MNMLKHVVFDFDGTLVDSNAIKRDTFFKITNPWDTTGEIAAGVLERWPAADRYEKTRRIAEELISRKLLPEGSSLKDWASHLAEEYTAQCEKAISCCPEMPGASQVLKELSATGFHLFVNSATPVEPLRKILKLRNWGHFFQGVYGAELAKADNLGQIAETTGATPKEIVHVGDQPDDLQATEQFGCHFVAMADGNSRHVAEASDLVVQELGELPGLLKNLDREAS